MTGPGGYQQPASPAPVSGPGALSARTDGGPAQPIMELPDAQYGEAKEFRETQQAAPLSATPMPASVQAGFAAPTANPGQPITDGAPVGPGRGVEGITQARTGRSRGAITDVLSRLAAVDPSDGIAKLFMEAQRRGV